MTLGDVVSKSISIAQALRLLDRALVGSNYEWFKRVTAKQGIDITHFKGQRHGTSSVKKYSTEVLIANSPISTGTIKEIVLREGLLPYVCACCEQPPLWFGKSLTLRLDHKNGTNNDHRLENLQFLCPNCDSQTDTFCGRNKKKSATRLCSSCGDPSPTRKCRSCAAFVRAAKEQKTVWPDCDTLVQMIAQTSFLAVGRDLGVSDNAVRKHLRVRGRVV